MKTLEKIKSQGEEILFKLKAQQPITDDEKKVLKIYTSLTSKKAFNAGKRKP